MRFSLIITTLGRTHELIALFDSIRAQNRRDVEVILVDQNRDDRLTPIVADHAHGLNLTHVKLTVAGASRGRNAGLNRAVGELVGFPDDDCELADDFLNRVDQVFNTRPEVAGMTTNTNDKNRPVERGQWDAGTVRLNRVNVIDKCVEFSTYLRREVVGTLRYNEDLGVGSGTLWGADEGPDLLIRLMDRGAGIYFFPNLTVFHPEKQLKVSKAILARALSYSRGRGRLYRLHGFPASVVVKSLVRSAGGVVVSALKLDPKRSAYYSMVFFGKLRGVLS